MIDVLEALGVEIVSASDKEIKALCPVHHLAVGRSDTHPSWYMNATTGAWLCFSCQQRGSLYTLVELLGADPDVIGRAPVIAMKAKVDRWQEEEKETPAPAVEVSERKFNRNPYPPVKMLAKKDIDRETAELMNIRWDKAGKFFLLPIYDFKGSFMGWQEKGTGYFNNVPRGVPKSGSLFGYQSIATARAAMVESPLDAARLQCHGFDAVSVYGSYTSAEQIEAMARAVDTVILAFDNDDSGYTASAIASRMFTKLGVTVKFFAYEDGTEGLDPGELSEDQLHSGFFGATSIAPPAVRAAASKPYKRKPKEEEDPMNKMRSWAASAKRRA